MNYTLVVLKKAQKDLKKIDPRVRCRILDAFILLKIDPFCGKALSGEYAGIWSYRVWPYRILYTIRKSALLVTVVKVGHRQGVY